MTLNAKLAYEVLDFIEAHPEKHDQGWFFSSCGTTACFAGWTALLSGDHNAFANGLTTAFVHTPDGMTKHIEDRAVELLGIEYRDALQLFYEAENLSQLRVAVEKIFGPRPAVLESAR